MAPAAPQMPSALFRSPPSGKMFMTIESAAGSTMAAPSPWIPRMMTRTVSVVARPPPSDPAAKTPRPIINSRRRPSRSAARPPSSRKPPKVNPYAETTHCRSDPEKCSFAPMVGSETLTIVRSTMVMKYATTSSAKARHGRASGAGMAAAAGESERGIESGRRCASAASGVVGRTMGVSPRAGVARSMGETPARRRTQR